MTSAPIAVIDGVPISLSEALGAALSLLAALAALSLIALWRAGAARRREREIADERQEAIEARFAALAQSSAELSGRIGGMSEWLGSRQTDLARVVADRLDSVGARLGAGLERPGADDRRKSWQAQRASRRHRRGAVAHERNDARSGVAQGHSLQQAVPRRLRSGEDGGDRARRLARGRLRVPVHALQPSPPRLRHPPAGRRAAARRRRQVPARRLHRVARRARRRNAQDGAWRGCARTSASTSRTSPSATFCPARRRTWR